MTRRTLADMSLLSKRIEEITMMDLRRAPGDVLDQVMLGKTYVITRQGKLIAVLQRLPGDTLMQVVDRHGNVSYDVNS